MTYYRRSLHKGLIVSLDDSGTVLDISPCEDIDSEAGVEFYNGILLPAFVNAHCHLELSYMRGLIPHGGGFTNFARSMGRSRAGATIDERQAAAEYQDAVMWRSGIGAVGDVCNGSTTFGIKSDSSIKYVNFLELFGLGTACADILNDLAVSAADCGLTATITPHSTYSLNDFAFKSAVNAGDSSLPLSIHFMESSSERELYAGTGELHDWYAERQTLIDFAAYGSPAQRITECVPPHRNIMLIHNCFVTSEDVDMIETHFTGRVTWVLSPRSNIYISGILPPVDLLRRKGVNIAIGTDSLASNTSLDMISELRALGSVPLEEALWWATGAGAEALGLKGQVGELEVGYQSGVVLIDGIDWDNMSLTERSSSRRIV